VPHRLLGVSITDPTLVAKKYLRSWFTFDFLIGAFPIDYVFEAAAGLGGGGAASGWRLLRTLKVVRLYRIGRHSSQIDAIDFQPPRRQLFRVNPSVKTLLALLLSLCMYWHWVACVYQNLVNAVSDTQSDWWTVGDSEWLPPGGLLAASSADHYIYALYWSVGLTCQINLPLPDTRGALAFSLFGSMSGVLTLSMIIGAATTAVADLSAQSSEFSRGVQRIARLLQHKQLPMSLQHRILGFYAFQHESAQLDEADLLVNLPRSLRLQIDVAMHRPLFLHVPLFRMCSDEEILMVVQCLKPGLALPSETIIRQGERGTGIFFIMKGVVEILRDEQQVKLMSAIAVIGESALLEEATSPSTVRGVKFCEVAALTCVDFNALAEHVPMLRYNLQVYISSLTSQKADAPRSIKSKWAQVKVRAVAVGSLLHTVGKHAKESQVKPAPATEAERSRVACGAPAANESS